MTQGRLYFFSKNDPDRPQDANYVIEIGEERKYFFKKEEALLYLFDNGVKQYQYLTKEIREYKNTKQILTYDFWHIGNRVGYVIHDYEFYADENDEVKKRKAYVWRFVGFGRSCFAPTKEELEAKVSEHIQEYWEDREKRGYNEYPYYTRYYRAEYTHSALQ